MDGCDQDIKIEDLKQLFEIALRTTYKVKESDTKAEGFMFNCLKLFGKDYKFSVISNANGELCTHYPSKIVILEYVKGNPSSCKQNQESIEPLYDVTKLKDLFSKARFARCRARFAVPVILFEGKHVCRSATISGGAEIYGRSGLDMFTTGGESVPGEHAGQVRSASEWQLFDRIRGQDILLLKELSIGYICDLMVEKKKVKFGMNVTSSEKVDKENRYSDFTILTVPYPGCEFFKEWRENGFRADGMMFDWKQSYVDADLELPGTPRPPHSIDWSRYKQWDLVLLTQNYLKLFLHYTIKGDSGVLIHCISGWDRTPLFTSLLRLSLWADMAAHQSLGPLDILYLTIAYDWFLFGHNFPDRLAKGEDIFFFCFHFLKYMTSEDFTVTRMKKNRRAVNRIDSEFGIEGVLLADSELHHTGSNTSINSTSSLNSTKSSIDNAPIYFSVGGSPEEDMAYLSNNGATSIPANNSNCAFTSNNGASSSIATNVKNNTNSVGVTLPRGGVNGTGNGVMRQQIDLRSHLMYQSTSPMAVPATVRQVQDVRNNSVSGSWQLISGSGSIRGSTSPYDQSPQCSSSSGGQSDQSTPGADSKNNDQSCDCDGHDNCEEDSPRKQRLDAVRRLFLSMYTSMMDGRTFTGPGAGGSGGITGLVGNFAEKLGIKSAKSTLV